MVYLDALKLEDVLDLDGLRETMRLALIDQALGRVTSSPRHVDRVPGGGIGLMVASCPDRRLLGYKTVAVFPGNPLLGLNPHQGIVALLEAETGVPRALLEASTLTALRTAATSAAVTERLARHDGRVLGVIGCGRQAYEHVRAIRRVLSINRVCLYSRSNVRALSLARRLAKEFSLTSDVFDSAHAVARESDVLVTVTPSVTPLVFTSDLRPGTHLNAIGACRPGMREVGFNSKVEVFVDSRHACATEASELTDVEIGGEVGNCLNDKQDGRASPRDITVFKSVGLGSQDLYAAEFFVHRARMLGRL